MLIDHLNIKFVAGSGGNGLMSFSKIPHEPRGKPDGGSGGRGGSVILSANEHILDLGSLVGKGIIKAADASGGGKNKRTGRKGQDVIIQVPVGTSVWELDSSGEKGELIGELNSPNDKGIVVAKGGVGGRGNSGFGSSTNRTPRLAEAGSEGEVRTTFVEYVAQAELGLISTSAELRESFAQKMAGMRKPLSQETINLLSVSNNIYNYSMVTVPTGSGYFGLLRHLSKCKLLIYLVDGGADIGEQVSYLEEQLAESQIKELTENSRSFNSMLIVEGDQTPPEGLRFDYVRTVSIEDEGSLQGLKNETLSIVTKLLKEEPETEPEAEDQEVLIQPLAGQGSPKVIDEGERVFRIVDESAVRLARGSNLNSWETLIQYRQKLKEFQIIKEMERLGVGAGDTVVIDDREFTWE